MTYFADRSDAGRQLAQALSAYAGRDDVIVLALPRGGVVVGFEVARALRAPLDVFLVRKLGVPDREELAMGAIGPGGVRVMNEDVVSMLGISRLAIEQVAARELEELERRRAVYRGDRPEPELRGKTAILVDDGLATGATMRAAVRTARLHAPARLIVAVPTAAPSFYKGIEDEADEFVCLVRPEPFMAVGGSYDDFSQTTDSEVTDLLARAAEGGAQ